MSTYTESLGLELITPGSQAGLWGNTTNNTFTLIDQAVTGVTELNFAGVGGTTITLTDYNGAVDEARSAVLNITGTATAANSVVVPNKQKMYLVRNNTGKNIEFKTSVPTDKYTVEAGNSILIFCDGNNNVYTGIAAPSVGTLTVSGGGTGVSTFGSGGFVKSSGGTANLTASTYVDLASDVTGTLPVSKGGTGATSFTSGGVLLGSGTGALGTVTASTNGYVLTWDSGTSSWKAAAPTSSGVTSLTSGTGISLSGATGAITVTNSGVTSLTAGTGISLSASTGGITISSTGSSGVTTFSAGSTGLTPSTATSGAVTLAGSLNVANGGTGATSNTGTAGSNVLSVSPTLTGTPLAPTAALATSTTQIATTEFARKNVLGLTEPMFGIGATTAASALTVQLNENQTVSYRNSSLTNGGVSFTTNTSAVPLTVPNGATLGTTNNKEAKLAILCLYNSGTPTLAICNTSGTVNLNESKLISANSSSPNSADSVYSTTSVSNSPFRVIGYVYITQSTAGAWITSPSLVQGCGGDDGYNMYYANSSSSLPETVVVSGVTSDTSSGAVVRYTNTSASSSVRNKYTRVNTAGEFDMLNSSYGTVIFNITDSGDMEIVGEGYKPGGGSWASSSDARLKENVQPLVGALDKILALSPVTYNWKYATSEITTSFLAQDVQEVIPTAVSESDPSDAQKPFIPSGEKVLNIGWKNDMMAYLVGAIKELKAELDALKAAK